MTEPAQKELVEMIEAARRLAAHNAYDIKDDGLFEAFHKIDVILAAALVKLVRAESGNRQGTEDGQRTSG